MFNSNTGFGTTGFGGSTFGAGNNTNRVGGVGFLGSQPTGGFGSTAGGFGTSTSTTGFGSTGVSSPFAPKTGFGTSAQPSQGLSFGSTPSTGFGSTFGRTSPSSTSFGTSTPFGKSTGFGSTAPTNFGSSNTGFTSNFGGTTAFGATSQPQLGTTAPSFGFGTQTPASSGFGASTTAFGASTTGFGVSQPASTPFASSGAFGSSTGFGSAFGSGVGAFGSTGQVGTAGVTFTPLQTKDTIQKNGVTNSVTCKIQAISSMPQFENKSLEELRWEDYQKGNKPSSGSTFGMSGATTGFGSATKPTFGFGAGTTSGFGQTATTSFGSPAGTTSVFGASSAPAFGASTTTFGSSTPAFGAANTGFGTSTGFGTTTQPTSTFSFGQSGGFGSTLGGFSSATNPSGSFGQQSSAPAFGASGTTGFGTTGLTSAFGGTSAPTFGFGGNTFGTSGATTTGFGQSATSGFGSTVPAFGHSTTTGTGPTAFGTGGFGTGGVGTSGFVTSAFGKTASPSFGTNTAGATGAGLTGFGTGFGSFGGFGANTGQQQTSTFGFGSGNAGFGSGSTAFGANKPAFGFGTQPTPSFGSFGGSFGTSNTIGSSAGFQQPANVFGGLGQPPAQSFASTIQPDINQKIDYIKKKRDELEIHLSDEKTSSSKPPVEQSLPGSISIKSIPNYSSFSLGNRKIHKTSARIIPRGYRSDEKSSKSINSNSNENLSSSASKAELLNQQTVKRLIIADMNIERVKSSPIVIQPIQTNYDAERVALKDHDKRLETPSKLFGDTDDRDSFRLQSQEKDNIKFTKDSKDIHRLAYKDYGEQTGLTPAETSSPSVLLEQNVSPIPAKRAIFPDDDASATPLSLGNQSYLSVSVIGPPNLSREDYGCIPDIKILRGLNDQELSRIRNFTVYRKGYGEIIWEEEIDVRGLDLDSIVTIEHKEVKVYDDTYVASFGRAPPRGTGLNRPATIILRKIYPKDANKLTGYEDKLRKYCESNDAEFISYDPKSGDWIFHVEHFSRYGIQDSDDEDENIDIRKPLSTPASTTNIQLVQNPPKSVTETLEKPAPVNTVKKLHIVSKYKYSTASIEEKTGETVIGTAKVIRPMQLRSLERTPYPRQLRPSTGVDTRKRPFQSIHSGSVILGTPVTSKLKVHEPLTVQKAISSSQYIAPHAAIIEMKPRSLLAFEYDDLDGDIAIESKYFHPHDAMHVSSDKSHAKSLYLDIASQPRSTDDSPMIQILREVKQNYFASIGKVPIREDLSRVSGIGAAIDSKVQKPIRHYGLAMRNSFRVGFSPFGHIAHLGRALQGNHDPKNVLATHVPNRRTVLIERIDPLAWLSSQSSQTVSGLDDSHRFRFYNESMSIIFKHSHKETVVPLYESISSTTTLVPFWRVPSCDPNDYSNYIPFLDMINHLEQLYNQNESISINKSQRLPDWNIKQALKLINASVGQEMKVFPNRLRNNMISSRDYESKYDILPFCEDMNGFIPSQIDRRKQALVEWFQSMSPIQDAGRTFDINDDVYYQIFELLTSQRINEAINKTESNGLYRLATILSQLDGDMTIIHLIRHQLDIWKLMNADQIISNDILMIYRLIAGDFFPNESWNDSIFSDVSWIQAIGSLFLYSLESKENKDKYLSEDNVQEELATIAPLATALECYQRALSESWVNPPYPPYYQDDQDLSSDPIDQSHGLFSLLRLLYPFDRNQSNDSLIHEILNPLSYTKDHLDYRGCYQLLILLESIGYLNMNSTDDQEASTASYIIRQQYISQLIYEGHWNWALFIAMQIPNNNVRYNTVKDLIYRYAGQFDDLMHERPHDDPMSTNKVANKILSTFSDPLQPQLHTSDQDRSLLTHHSLKYYYWEEHPQSYENQVMNQFSCPSSLLYESTGIRYYSDHEYLQSFHYYILSPHTTPMIVQLFLEKLGRLLILSHKNDSLQSSIERFNHSLKLLQNALNLLDIIDSKVQSWDWENGNWMVIDEGNYGNDRLKYSKLIGNQSNREYNMKRYEEYQSVKRYFQYLSTYFINKRNIYSDFEETKILDTLFHEASNMLYRAWREGGIGNGYQDA